MEELIGEEHQQRGNRLKQDAIGDVTTAKKTSAYNLNAVFFDRFSKTSAAPVSDTGKARNVPSWNMTRNVLTTIFLVKLGHKTFSRDYNWSISMIWI